MSDRTPPPNPYDFLPALPALTVTSADVHDGERMDDVHASGKMGAGGQDRSPQLTWSGAPEGTRSFTVSCYDPDAPTASGFWHWFVVDIPAEVTTLAADAGDPDAGLLPEGAVMLANDAGFPGYVGAAPPAGHGPHRYHFVVHAVGEEQLGVPAEGSCAFAGFNLFSKALARGLVVPTWEA